MTGSSEVRNRTNRTTPDRTVPRPSKAMGAMAVCEGAFVGAFVTVPTHMKPSSTESFAARMIHTFFERITWTNLVVRVSWFGRPFSELSRPNGTLGQSERPCV